MTAESGGLDATSPEPEGTALESGSSADDSSEHESQTVPKTGVPAVDDVLELVTSSESMDPTEAVAALDTAREKLEDILSESSESTRNHR